MLPTAFACQDGAVAVDIRAAPTGARLRVAATYLDLMPAASEEEGAVFSDAAETITLRLTSEGAVITLPGGTLDCRRASSAGTLQARGNEPPWQLTVEGETAILREGYDQTLRAAGPLTPLPSGGFTIGDSGLRIHAQDRVARDSMSGLPYPLEVQITGPEGTLFGAGGPPEGLLEGLNWRLRAPSGEAPAEPPQDLMFAEGRVSGNAGCNRFMGSAEVTGEGLRLGPLGSTMMACPEAVMDVEQAFLAQLAQVTGYDFAPNGDLLLRAGGDTVLTFRPALFLPR